jgi:hypothetical protein
MSRALKHIARKIGTNNIFFLLGFRKSKVDKITRLNVYDRMSSRATHDRERASFLPQSIMSC